MSELDRQISKAAQAYVVARRGGAKTAEAALDRYRDLTRLVDQVLRLETVPAPEVPSPAVEPVRPWWDRD